MNEQAILTYHSQGRLFGRVGGHKKGSQKMADRALLHGISHSETTGRLNKYLDSLWFYNKTANNMRVYGNNIYIFCNEVLITVYTLPSNFHSAVKKIKKRKESESD